MFVGRRGGWSAPNWDGRNWVFAREGLHASKPVNWDHVDGAFPEDIEMPDEGITWLLPGTGL